ncbi:MAG: hypothetical protein WKG00_22465 [Polyangiaceae bacterium]
MPRPPRPRLPPCHAAAAAALLASLTSGCTAYSVETARTPTLHPFAPPPAGHGEICVVRPHVTGMLAVAVVHDNDVLVGATRGPTYFCYLAAPGSHRVTSTYGDDIDRELGTDVVAEASVVVAAGSRHYLHQDVRTALSMSVAWVDEGTARRMIDDCSPARLGAVPGSQALPPPVPLAPGAP